MSHALTSHDRRAWTPFVLGAVLVAATIVAIVLWQVTGNDNGSPSVASADSAPAETASSPSSASGAEITTEPSLHTFLDQLGNGIGFDYEPLASPSDALARGDLIIVGAVVDIQPGLEFSFEGRELGRNVTLVIKTERVVSGPETGDTAYIQMPVSGSASVDELKASNPGSRIVAVLEDLTSFTPLEGASAKLPEGAAADATLYTPWIDGLWFESESGAIEGVFADREFIPPAWGTITTIDDYVGKLDTEAARP